MGRALDFVDSFDKTVAMMKDNLPKDMMIIVSVYARDTADKSDNFPDGEIQQRIIEKSTAYDRHTNERMLREEGF